MKSTLIRRKFKTTTALHFLSSLLPRSVHDGIDLIDVGLVGICIYFGDCSGNIVEVPHFIDSLDHVVDHLGGVEGGGRQSETLRSDRHCGVVDWLDVYSVLVEEPVGSPLAES